MAQSTRTRLHRVPKREQEVRVIANPSEQSKCCQCFGRSAKQRNSQRQRLVEPDYQAPLTSNGLRPNSRWLIVRRSLHRIRFMGISTQIRDSTVPDLYHILQIIRELKRAQVEIKNIDKEENFHAVKYFTLAVDNKRTKTYDTSHVNPDDALIYDRLGEEPLAVQNLLYYFSQLEVAHGTLFWDFLNEVNRVMHMKTKRIVRVERLRKLAFTLAIILYGIIGLMLFLLIISVITTATKMNDPEVQWMEPNIDSYSGKNFVSS
jgi:hypothetical protein